MQIPWIMVRGIVSLFLFSDVQWYSTLILDLLIQGARHLLWRHEVLPGEGCLNAAEIE